MSPVGVDDLVEKISVKVSDPRVKPNGVWVPVPINEAGTVKEFFRDPFFNKELLVFPLKEKPLLDLSKYNIDPDVLNNINTLISCDVVDCYSNERVSLTLCSGDIRTLTEDTFYVDEEQGKIVFLSDDMFRRVGRCYVEVKYYGLGTILRANDFSRLFNRVVYLNEDMLGPEEKPDNFSISDLTDFDIGTILIHQKNNKIRSYLLVSKGGDSAQWSGISTSDWVGTPSVNINFIDNKIGRISQKEIDFNIDNTSLMRLAGLDLFLEMPSVKTTPFIDENGRKYARFLYVDDYGRVCAKSIEWNSDIANAPMIESSISYRMPIVYDEVNNVVYHDDGVGYKHVPDDEGVGPRYVLSTTGIRGRYVWRKFTFSDFGDLTVRSPLIMETGSERTVIDHDPSYIHVPTPSDDDVNKVLVAGGQGYVFWTDLNIQSRVYDITSIYPIVVSNVGGGIYEISHARSPFLHLPDTTDLDNGRIYFLKLNKVSRDSLSRWVVLNLNELGIGVESPLYFKNDYTIAIDTSIFSSFPSPSDRTNYILSAGGESGSGFDVRWEKIFNLLNGSLNITLDDNSSTNKTTIRLNSVLKNMRRIELTPLDNGFSSDGSSNSYVYIKDNTNFNYDSSRGNYVRGIYIDGIRGYNEAYGISIKDVRVDNVGENYESSNGLVYGIHLDRIGTTKVIDSSKKYYSAIAGIFMSIGDSSLGSKNAYGLLVSGLRSIGSHAVIYAVDLTCSDVGTSRGFYLSRVDSSGYFVAFDVSNVRSKSSTTGLNLESIGFSGRFSGVRMKNINYVGLSGAGFDTICLDISDIKGDRNVYGVLLNNLDLSGFLGTVYGFRFVDTLDRTILPNDLRIFSGAIDKTVRGADGTLKTFYGISLNFDLTFFNNDLNFTPQPLGLIGLSMNFGKKRYFGSYSNGSYLIGVYLDLASSYMLGGNYSIVSRRYPAMFLGCDSFLLTDKTVGGTEEQDKPYFFYNIKNLGRKPEFRIISSYWNVGSISLGTFRLGSDSTTAHLLWHIGPYRNSFGDLSYDRSARPIGGLTILNPYDLNFYFIGMDGTRYSSGPVLSLGPSVVKINNILIGAEGHFSTLWYRNQKVNLGFVGDWTILSGSKIIGTDSSLKKYAYLECDITSNMFDDTNNMLSYSNSSDNSEKYITISSTNSSVSLISPDVTSDSSIPSTVLKNGKSYLVTLFYRRSADSSYDLVPNNIVIEVFDGSNYIPVASAGGSVVSTSGVYHNMGWQVRQNILSIGRGSTNNYLVLETKDGIRWRLRVDFTGGSGDVTRKVDVAYIDIREAGRVSSSGFSPGFTVSSGEISLTAYDRLVLNGLRLFTKGVYSASDNVVNNFLANDTSNISSIMFVSWVSRDTSGSFGFYYNGGEYDFTGSPYTFSKCSIACTLGGYRTYSNGILQFYIGDSSPSTTCRRGIYFDGTDLKVMIDGTIRKVFLMT